MARNYQKENEWQKQKYTKMSAHLDKEIAKELKEYLQKNNLSFAEWLRQKIAEN